MSHKIPLALAFAFFVMAGVAAGRPVLSKEGSTARAVGYLMVDGKRVEVPFPVIHGAFSFEYPGSRLSLRPEDEARMGDEEPDDEPEVDVSEPALLARRTACEGLPPAPPPRGDKDDDTYRTEHAAWEEGAYATGCSPETDRLIDVSAPYAATAKPGWV